uniref:Uncharacterized protein n=1 Tax=Anguilla anguilla TaxID=7936 RepID=A0A0E9Q8S4_ANGAN
MIHNMLSSDLLPWDIKLASF